MVCVYCSYGPEKLCLRWHQFYFSCKQSFGRYLSLKWRNRTIKDAILLYFLSLIRWFMSCLSHLHISVRKAVSVLHALLDCCAKKLFTFMSNKTPFSPISQVKCAYLFVFCLIVEFHQASVSKTASFKHFPWWIGHNKSSDPNRMSPVHVLRRFYVRWKLLKSQNFSRFKCWLTTLISSCRQTCGDTACLQYI